MRNRIILRKCHRLVELLLEHLREKWAHCGYKRFVYEWRKQFWIVAVRYMAEHLTGKCGICKKLRKKTLEQLMGQMPNLRVAAGFPELSNTAIDIFEPLQIRLARKLWRKHNHEIIFTWMTTRAVHLELVTDRSTDTLLMAFRRFVSLSGNPNNCWSDCGTNFIGAQHYRKKLLKDWDIPTIQSVVSEEFSCTFQLSWNVPRASHQSGIVELSKKTNPHRRAVEDVFSRVKCLIDECPLYQGLNGICENPPITPNDLLIRAHFPSPMPEVESKVNPRHLMRSTQKRVQEFWKCWMKYFAPSLLRINKWS